ncbi:hypothetical protein PIB30_069395, partial [Stylosanthes scabra]|nr:hypothetical protein [Stylosanthes scabra]
LFWYLTLAPPDDEPKQGGGYLGVFNKGEESQVVAVEFDTFINDDSDIDDRRHLHIGIDFKSIKSRHTAAWEFKNGEEGIAYISYDTFASNTFKVTFFYPSYEKSYVSQSIYRLPLKGALSEWVRVGFSASSGESDPEYVETHEVNSWYLASSFEHNPADLAEAFKAVNPRLASSLNLHFGE